MFFLIFLLDDRKICIQIRSRIRISDVMDPDPGGPKTYGSYGSGSATLLIMVIFSWFQITWWEPAARCCRACVESWPSAGIPSPIAGSPSSGNDDIQNHHIPFFFYVGSRGSYMRTKEFQDIKGTVTL